MNQPVDTEAFMLHRSPMRLVRRLACVEDDYARAETVLESGDVGVGPDGNVEAAALLEIVAQTYAAAQGYRDRAVNRSPALGYLVVASDFVIEQVPSAGQWLQIEVRSSRSFEEFYLVEGSVLCEDRVLAHGTLKAWVQPAQEPGAE
jgi:predicted hotdog family 3-hydroxylacyl-ACP dehydratase